SRDELAALLALGTDAARAELTERFAAPMEFGTAGLRGLIGAGPGRMNVATVVQAAAAVAREALQQIPDAKTRGVVIGRDGRIKSDVFAQAAAEVFAAHGIHVYWVPKPAPTPLMAYLGRVKQAAAICIVTASHNPPEYNGFKVYGPTASQIVPPQDERIRDLRAALESTLAIPRVPFSHAVRRKLVTVVSPRELDGFIDAVSAQCFGANPPPAQVAAVTTALHGVGHYWVAEALTRRGHRHLYPVLAQASPDGRFPTVRFPNPEEKGALDLALELAREKFADLILANDPDTDRLCVAVRDASSSTGYRVLTGNEVGLLLADWVLTAGPAADSRGADLSSAHLRGADLSSAHLRGENPSSAHLGRWPEKPFVACSLVSTAMLEPLARARGASYAEVLTGFKWIWHKALEREAVGETFVFGFEEALGYCVGQAVRDKDGVGAAQAIMDLAAFEKAQGRTLLDRLDTIAELIGVSHTDQVALTLPGMEGMARIARIMKAWRVAPPDALGGVAVARRRDLAGPDAEAEGLPRGDVLTWWLADGSRIVARPSGTEPKLKVYLETRQAVGADGLAAARARAKVACEAIAADLRARIAGIA
ncbi:MAG: phospho-sugar mutase, partial [Deltaproteobacteria bacterium]|nr:phospho-sugar mutase [Deltaproteobacteria bacterium]